MNSTLPPALSPDKLVLGQFYTDSLTHRVVKLVGFGFDENRVRVILDGQYCDVGTFRLLRSSERSFS